MTDRDLLEEALRQLSQTLGYSDEAQERLNDLKRRIRKRLEDKHITCPNCEYHKIRAARWRSEAYKQSGQDVIELPWVGLTDEERHQISLDNRPYCANIMRAHEEELKRRNT